jgi:hypothetical protein
LPELGWHVEHIIAFSSNPNLDVTGNLLPAHPQCNLWKSNLDLETAVSTQSDELTNIYKLKAYDLTILTSVIKQDQLLPQVKEALLEAKQSTKQNFLPGTFVTVRIDTTTEQIIEQRLNESFTVVQFSHPKGGTNRTSVLANNTQRKKWMKK